MPTAKERVNMSEYLKKKIMLCFCDMFVKIN